MSFMSSVSLLAGKFIISFCMIANYNLKQLVFEPQQGAHFRWPAPGLASEAKNSENLNLDSKFPLCY